MKKQKFFLLPLLLFMLALLVMPKTAVEGAKNGLLLWFQTVLPALLPFIILSNLLLSSNGAAFLGNLFYPLLHRLFFVSRDGAFALFIGFFCGFPMGAKVVSDLYLKNRISKAEADYLLGFCNNFSPMFLLGFVSALHPQLPAWNLLLVVFGAPLLFGFCTRKKIQVTVCLPEAENRFAFSFSWIDASIMNGFEAITKIGGYLILFGIFAKMVTVLPTVTILKSVLLVFTEITTGVYYLAATGLPALLKECLLFAGLCFGGLSGLAQTKSMLGASALSIRPYLATRFKITIIAVCLALSCYFIRNLPV